MNNFYLKVLLIVVIIFHCLPAYCADNQNPCLTLQGKLISGVKLPVYMTYPAVVTEVLVTPGDKVKHGQKIFRYKLEQTALIRIREMIAPRGMKELEIRLHDIQKNIKLLKLDEQDQRKLIKQGFGNKQILKKLAIQLDHLNYVYQKTKEILQQQKRIIKNNLEILKNELGVAFSEGNIPQKIVSKSPTNGTVVWTHQLMRKGALVDLKKPICFIAHLDNIILQARVHENEALKLKLNQKGSLACNAIPGKKFESKLQAINWTPIRLSVTEPPYYLADFKITNNKSILREGLQCRVEVGKNCP
jgi:multidrug resistance efflux pump